MGILTSIGTTFGTDDSNVSRIVQAMMQQEYRANVEDAINYAKEWQPTLDNGYTFRQEMEARTNYMQGSMWGDMSDVLLERFPQTHAEIDSHQLNVSLFRRLIESKARAFYGQGTRFYVEGKDGEELPPEHPSQVAFQRMMEKGRFYSALKGADRYTQALSRAMVKCWWDARMKCVQATVWPQHLVWMVPNPDAHWSLDDCPAVLFEMPGRQGLSTECVRYEVWAKAREGAAWKTIHYRTGKVREDKKDKNGKIETTYNWTDEAINETNTFPFKDEETGEPVYPFWLWQSDTLLMLYAIGSEDALTVPRQVNAAMTDMAHSLHYNANPISMWVPTRPDVTSMPPAVFKVGPGEMVQGGDFKVEFAHPEYDAKQIQEVWNGICDMAIQMDVGTSSGVIQEQGGPESGIAVAIKRQPLYEYRQDMIEIYRPHVIETLKRAVMVHNTYCDAGDRIDGVPCWEPGDVVDVQDKDAEAKMWVLKIEKNIATPVDWLMHESGMDREQAEERIKANVEENRELRQGSMVVMPGEEDPNQPPAPFGSKPAVKKDEAEEDEVDYNHAGIGIPEKDVERK
jgi:hypothetical protein